MRECGDDILRHLGDLLHPGVSRVAEAEAAEGVLLELAVLRERDAQPGTRRNHHRRSGQQGESVWLVGSTSDGPALLLFALRFQDRGGREAVLLIICQRSGEAHGHRSADGKGLVFVWRRGGLALPHDLAFVIQQHDAKPFETRARAAVRAVPHDDAVHRFGRLEIDLPPWIVVGAGGVGHAAFCVIALGVAIDGTLGGGIGVQAALRGDTGGGDVVAAAEDLHLGQLQQFLLSRQLDAHIARLRCLPGIRRHDFRFHVGDDVVAESGGGQRLDAQRAELVARSGEFDGVAVCVAVFGNRNGAACGDGGVLF